MFVLLLFFADSSVCTRFPIDSGPAELLSLGDNKGGGLGSSVMPGDAALLRELDPGVKGGGAVFSGRGSTGMLGGGGTSALLGGEETSECAVLGRLAGGGVLDQAVSIRNSPTS